MSITVEHVKQKLQEALQATEVDVSDTSGGCGQSFDVAVVSPLFEGKTLLARHRLVNDALKSEMSQIHALSIKSAKAPGQ
mmetsp:Transcript_34107/g.86304  ORF Transcript_34107/g.86304 Transcript_34107/m.86304 type:complete len:80 (-) Transcript_34107:267-506(-)|eukprot:CAMPEP_0202860830 /NCGR_PEP_ID=MMETSP1391-20130828/2421_1 /ASSEMBLY_ACC=CAM_ASM_000867 /TAXON_ID=1034604 /ORGANISM="Chlamydomonas leiostraca, Strain SAG 11-49" /LENGTH=79 /DNA_ID=CAMNT_0049540091 /DNA_START=47 /DNA_END=286 /DNA_ORIENTATION=-